MLAGIGYARRGVAIAYQVVGAREIDLVYVPDYVSNLVYGWESRHWRRFYERLAQSFRLILFDKRGTGLSDHGAHFAALETRMEDLRAVLDAVGSSSAVVFGAHEGCAMAALYAATYPERTRALVLFHPVAHAPGTEDREVQQELSEVREQWGVQAWCDELLRSGCPTLYANVDDRRWFANWLRVGASPAVAYALNRAFQETDLREVLPAVRVPRLVLYRQAPFDTEDEALDVAAQIPDARAMRVFRRRLLRDLPLTRHRGGDRTVRGRRRGAIHSDERPDDADVHRPGRLHSARERTRRPGVAGAPRRPPRSRPPRAGALPR